MNARKKKPWPTKDAMIQIYERNLWGGENGHFYSGDGSHLSQFVEPYINAVCEFLRGFQKPLTVCDLGCGDFNIGREISKYSSNYVGIDIVPELIERNSKTFDSENTKFICGNIAEIEIPKADCYIVRQVFQHIPNEEIQRVLHKLKDYQFLILTEHIPSASFKANQNIIAGQGIRLKHQSGIDLTQPPFEFKFEKKTELCKIPAQKGVIQTLLFQSRNEHF